MIPEIWSTTDRIFCHLGLFVCPKITIISYTVPERSCVADVIIIFHFGIFFADNKHIHFRQDKPKSILLQTKHKL